MKSTVGYWFAMLLYCLLVVLPVSDALYDHPLGTKLLFGIVCTLSGLGFHELFHLGDKGKGP